MSVVGPSPAPPFTEAPRSRRIGAMDRIVVIFGAGATKACGGPLTNEILPDVFASRAQLARRDHVERLEQFLVDNFHLPKRGPRKPDQFPPLPLVLSLIDTALDREDA